MITEAFAAGAGAATGGSQSILMNVAPLAAMFLIFYFILIRPQAKKQKELQRMLESLKPGNSVVTSGGIHGTIVKIKDDIITLQVAENVRIKVNKGAIGALSLAQEA
ncbi:MAG: preprotein translocase subunit YajC [Nitrospinae bacterium]|nr:preprotein translocase subunit YajC [Nitrospinota bacterium]